MKKKSVWALALAAMLMWVGKPAVAAVNEAFDPVEYVQEIPIRRSLVRGV